MSEKQTTEQALADLESLVHEMAHTNVANYGLKPVVLKRWIETIQKDIAAVRAVEAEKKSKNAIKAVAGR